MPQPEPSPAALSKKILASPCACTFVGCCAQGQAAESLLSKISRHTLEGFHLHAPEFREWCAELRADLTKLGLLDSKAKAALAELETQGTTQAQAKRQVAKLKEIAEPMNLSDLVHRLKEAEDSAACIKGKPVALLIGNSGCGKSTTVRTRVAHCPVEHGMWHGKTLFGVSPDRNMPKVPPYPPPVLAHRALTGRPTSVTGTLLGRRRL